jgi:hypothetical protein
MVQANYADPKTKLRFASPQEYRRIQSLSENTINSYLALRFPLRKRVLTDITEAQTHDCKSVNHNHNHNQLRFPIYSCSSSLRSVLYFSLKITLIFFKSVSALRSALRAFLLASLSSVAGRFCGFFCGFGFCATRCDNQTEGTHARTHKHTHSHPTRLHL